MHTLEHDRHDGEPTKRETPSGKWIIAVDRAQRLIQAAIVRLEPHDENADVALAIRELRSAASLAGGGAT